jgi:hypothetical protein
MPDPAESAVDSHPADFDVRAVGLGGAELGYRSLDVGAGGSLGPLSLGARQGMQRGPGSILFDDALDCQRHQLAAVECRIRLHERMIGLVPQKSLLLVTVQAARRRRSRLVLERPQQFLELQPLFDGDLEIGLPVESAQQRLLRGSGERGANVFERDGEVRCGGVLRCGPCRAGSGRSPAGRRGLTTRRRGRTTGRGGLDSRCRGLTTWGCGLATWRRGLATRRRGLITSRRGLTAQQERRNQQKNRAHINYDVHCPQPASRISLQPGA